MKIKTIWIITVLLFLGHLILQYTVIKTSAYIEQLGFIYFIVEIISEVFTAAFIGALIGALTALIPYKKMNFGRKFRATLPISLSLSLIVVIFSFAYVAFIEKTKGVVILPSVKYEYIKCKPGLDYAKIIDGKFETKEVIVERQGNRQVQISKDTKKETVFEVEWLSDCEYCLTPLDKPSVKIKVKVISVNEEGYNCYVKTGEYATGYQMKIIDTVANK